MHVVLGVLLRLDDLGVGQQQRAVVHGRELAAIEQFGGAQHVGIVAALERVAQDQMAELRQEDRRQVAGALAGQRHIHRLQRRRRDQPVAEIHHEGPVLARIGVGERGDIGWLTPGAADRPAGSHADRARPRRHRAGGINSGRAR